MSYKLNNLNDLWKKYLFSNLSYIVYIVPSAHLLRYICGGCSNLSQGQERQPLSLSQALNLAWHKVVQTLSRCTQRIQRPQSSENDDWQCSWSIWKRRQKYSEEKSVERKGGEEEGVSHGQISTRSTKLSLTKMILYSWTSARTPSTANGT